MVGAILGWAWLGDRLAPSRIVGLVIGFSGIVVLVWDEFAVGADTTTWATIAALTAPICYAIAANCTKRYLTGVDALTNAAGCMVSATILLLPFAIWTWPAQAVSAQAWTATILLAVLCTALAYTLFFRLIASVGPTAAVSVTFLVPVFGVFWGAFLLDEEITATIVAGAAIILAGTALSLGLIRLPRTARTP
jgi:drug/metabolite transporter (DMT)-like permease